MANIGDIGLNGDTQEFDNEKTAELTLLAAESDTKLHVLDDDALKALEKQVREEMSKIEQMYKEGMKQAYESIKNTITEGDEDTLESAKKHTDDRLSALSQQQAIKDQQLDTALKGIIKDVETLENGLDGRIDAKVEIVKNELNPLIEAADKKAEVNRVDIERLQKEVEFTQNGTLRFAGLVDKTSADVIALPNKDSYLTQCVRDNGLADGPKNGYFLRCKDEIAFFYVEGVWHASKAAGQSFTVANPISFENSQIGLKLASDSGLEVSANGELTFTPAKAANLEEYAKKAQGEEITGEWKFKAKLSVRQIALKDDNDDQIGSIDVDSDSVTYKTNVGKDLKIESGKDLKFSATGEMSFAKPPKLDSDATEDSHVPTWKQVQDKITEEVDLVPEYSATGPITMSQSNEIGLDIDVNSGLSIANGKLTFNIPGGGNTGFDDYAKKSVDETIAGSYTFAKPVTSNTDASEDQHLPNLKQVKSLIKTDVANVPVYTGSAPISIDANTHEVSLKIDNTSGLKVENDNLTFDVASSDQFDDFVTNDELKAEITKVETKIETVKTELLEKDKEILEQAKQDAITNITNLNNHITSEITKVTESITKIENNVTNIGGNVDTKIEEKLKESEKKLTEKIRETDLKAEVNRVDLDRFVGELEYIQNGTLKLVGLLTETSSEVEAQQETDPSWLANKLKAEGVRKLINGYFVRCSDEIAFYFINNEWHKGKAAGHAFTVSNPIAFDAGVIKLQIDANSGLKVNGTGELTLETDNTNTFGNFAKKDVAETITGEWTFQNGLKSDIEAADDKHLTTLKDVKKEIQNAKITYVGKNAIEVTKNHEIQLKIRENNGLVINADGKLELNLQQSGSTFEGFAKKDQAETITGVWTHNENIVLTKDATTDQHVPTWKQVKDEVSAKIAAIPPYTGTGAIIVSKNEVSLTVDDASGLKIENNKLTFSMPDVDAGVTFDKFTKKDSVETITAKWTFNEGITLVTDTTEDLGVPTWKQVKQEVTDKIAAIPAYVGEGAINISDHKVSLKVDSESGLSITQDGVLTFTPAGTEDFEGFLTNNADAIIHGEWSFTKAPGSVEAIEDYQVPTLGQVKGVIEASKVNYIATNPITFNATDNSFGLSIDTNSGLSITGDGRLTFNIPGGNGTSFDAYAKKAEDEQITGSWTFTKTVSGVDATKDEELTTLKQVTKMDTDLKAELVEADKQILEQAKADTVSKITEYNQTVENKFTEVNNKITSVEGEVTNIKTDIAEITNNITEIQNDITTIEGEVTNITNNITQIEENITNMGGDTDTKFDETKQELNNKIDSTKTELEEKINNSKTEITNKITEVEQKVDKNTTAITEVKAELEFTQNGTLRLVALLDETSDQVDTEMITDPNWITEKIKPNFPKGPKNGYFVRCKDEIAYYFIDKKWHKGKAAGHAFTVEDPIKFEGGIIKLELATDSGLNKDASGGLTLDPANNSKFNAYTKKAENESITGTWTYTTPAKSTQQATDGDHIPNWQQVQDKISADITAIPKYVGEGPITVTDTKIGIGLKSDGGLKVVGNELAVDLANSGSTFDGFAKKADDETITGKWTYNQAITSTTKATEDSQLPNLGQVKTLISTEAPKYTGVEAINVDNNNHQISVNVKEADGLKVEGGAITFDPARNTKFANYADKTKAETISAKWNYTAGLSTTQASADTDVPNWKQVKDEINKNPAFSGITWLKAGTAPSTSNVPEGNLYIIK